MAVDVLEERLPPDALEGVPLPRQASALVGHGAAERALLEAYRAGRMHHAWLVTGPRGVGKATFAFRAARFLLAFPEPADPRLADACDLAAPADLPAARKVARGTHPNVFHLQRDYDERNKRYRTEMSVETVRRLIPFVGATPGEGAWRIAVVDTADEMTRSAANALLKMLEEPPRRMVFFLLSESPGRLLPTILSRCRTLALRPLAPAEVAQALEAAGAALPQDASADLLLALAEGSPRRAIELARDEGLTLYRLLCQTIGAADARAMHRLADLASDGPSGAFARFFALFDSYLHRRVHGLPEPAGGAAGAAPPPALPLATWAALWEKAAQASREAAIYNLDRRQCILDLLETCVAAARQPREHRA